MQFDEIRKIINKKYSEYIAIDDEKQVIMVLSEWNKVAEFLILNKDLDFDTLLCITGYDNGDKLGIAYNFFSINKRHYIEIRIELDRKNAFINTISNIWKAADWHEREAYDMMGILFDGHPDMKRILLPEDWEGHPLRKDWKEPEFYNGMPVPKDKSYWE